MSNSRQIASQYKNKAIIGMDAHQIQDLHKDKYKRALDEISKYDVELVDDIQRIDYLAIKAQKALKEL